MKNSKDSKDVAKWIEKVIQSCKTSEQITVSKKLIFNFQMRLIKASPDKYWNTLHYDLILPLEEMAERCEELNFV